MNCLLQVERKKRAVHRWPLAPALWAIALAASGCPGHTPHLPSGLLDPIALDRQLVMIDGAGDLAFLVEVAGDAHAPAHEIALPHGTIVALRRNAADEALILALGRRAEAKKKAEPGMLSVLDAGGRLRRYELGNPFDRLAQSADGKYALLFKSGGSMRLLDNPNEVAIVDLDAAPEAGAAVSLRTLRSFGDSPIDVKFSPELMIAGELRRLALVLSHGNVALLDLTHQDRLETTVQLSGAGGAAVQPIDVAFHASDPQVYVRASSNDVFVFNLRERPADEPAPDDGEPHNDFRPFIDQVGVGGVPSDMQVYDSGGDARLLVLSTDGRTVSSVDPARSQITSVALSSPATQALLFEAAAPRDSERRTRALLYDPGSNHIWFLDLADLEARDGRSLEPLSLEQPIARLLPMPDERQALALHFGSGVSLIDLEARTISIINSVARLDDARFDGSRRTLWFGPPAQPFVGLLELQTGATSEILLDANVEQLVPVFTADRVAIVHAARAGSITLIDTTAPRRETTHMLRGFLGE